MITIKTISTIITLACFFKYGNTDPLSEEEMKFCDVGFIMHTNVYADDFFGQCLGELKNNFHYATTLPKIQGIFNYILLELTLKRMESGVQIYTTGGTGSGSNSEDEEVFRTPCSGSNSEDEEVFRTPSYSELPENETSESERSLQNTPNPIQKKTSITKRPPAKTVSMKVDKDGTVEYTELQGNQRGQEGIKQMSMFYIKLRYRRESHFWINYTICFSVTILFTSLGEKSMSFKNKKRPFAVVYYKFLGEFISIGSTKSPTEFCATSGTASLVDIKKRSMVLVGTVRDEYMQKKNNLVYQCNKELKELGFTSKWNDYTSNLQIIRMAFFDITYNDCEVFGKLYMRHIKDNWKIDESKALEFPKFCEVVQKKGLDVFKPLQIDICRG